MDARRHLAPRELSSAARASAAFAFAGALMLVVLSLTVPSFAPTPSLRTAMLTTGGVLVLEGLAGLTVPHRLPGLYWVFVPTQVVVLTVVLDLATGDASAAGQAFLIWPVLFAAYEMRPRVALAVLLQVLTAQAVVVFRLLPADRAVTDLVCLGLTLTVVCLLLVRAREREAGVVRRLRRQAATDPLTGVATRRVLDAAAAAALAAGPTAMMLVDVDHFKAVNDRLGHPAGDAVLVHVAGLLRAHVPPRALVARLGGDELAVLLPGTGLPEVTARAEEFRRALGTQGPRLPARMAVTVSVGVAAVDGGSPPHLYAAADRALYDAKRAGRDRVRGGGPVPVPAQHRRAGLAARA